MIRFLSSGRFTGILLAVAALALAAATFIENSMSTQAAKDIVYHNPAFFILLLLLCVNMALVMAGFLKAGRYGFSLLHLSFIVIMAGAAVTHFFSMEGLLHLREGAAENRVQDKDGNLLFELPFDVALEDFRMERYSDIGSPSSYESDIEIEGRKFAVSMNSFAKYRHFRLYQASYDRDLKGSVLSVNWDPAGITLTYIGYILMLVGFIWSMAEKGSRFRSLLSKSAVALLLLMPSFASGQVKEDALLYSARYAVPDTIAEKFSRLTMQTQQGRLQPVDTYSRDILQKLSKQRSFNGLSASQVLLGICTQQAVWTHVPFIRIGDDYLAGMLSLPAGTRFSSYSDAFDSEGRYLLEEKVDRICSKQPGERNASEKEILKYDERLNIMSELMSGRMLALFPKEGSSGWYSPSDDLTGFKGMDSVFAANAMKYISSKVSTEEPDWDKASELVDMIALYQQKKATQLAKVGPEILYNRMDAVRISGFGFMTMGILLVLSAILMMMKGKSAATTALTAISVMLLAYLTVSLALRWHISGNAPWSNAYESVVYVGWATALIGLFMKRRSAVIHALATFFAGAILFVSSLSFLDPQITPLVPVLKSYWLVVHVATITASYGFFGICFLIGVTTLVITVIRPSMAETSKLTGSNELLMWIGLALMTIGTFLGAVWANQSWGRYWGWDPKETWALITVIVYAIVLHTRHIFKGKRSSTAFAIMSVFALGTVLMTFFGVNYYLTGLHSYAGGSSPVGLKVIWIAYGFLSALSIAAVVRDK